MQTGQFCPRIWQRWYHPINTAKAAMPMWMTILFSGGSWSEWYPDDVYQHETYGPGHQVNWDWAWTDEVGDREVRIQWTYDGAIPESRWSVQLVLDGSIVRYATEEWGWSREYTEPSLGHLIISPAQWRNADGGGVIFAPSMRLWGVDWDICEAEGLAVPPMLPYTG